MQPVNPLDDVWRRIDIVERRSPSRKDARIEHPAYDDRDASFGCLVHKVRIIAIQQGTAAGHQAAVKVGIFYRRLDHETLVDAKAKALNDPCRAQLFQCA